MDAGAPGPIAFDGQGTLWFASEATGTGGDFGPVTGGQIWRVDAAGTARLFAGMLSPAGGSASDGVPALGAALGTIFRLAVSASGSVVFVEYVGLNSYIRRVNADGTLTTPASSLGSVSGAADGIPATQAKISATGIQFDADGNLIVANSQSATVSFLQQITPDGVVHLLAGGGTSAGDGAGRTLALSGIGAVHAGAGGRVWFVQGNAIRIYEPGGTVTSVAGHNVTAPPDGTRAGDMWFPTSAALKPGNIAAGPGGEVYFSEPCRIRSPDRSGILRTVAGNQTCGVIPEAGSAASGSIPPPWSMAAVSNGDVYFPDTASNIFRVSGGLITRVATGDPFSGGARLASDGRDRIYAAFATSGNVLRIVPGAATEVLVGTGGIYGPQLFGPDRQELRAAFIAVDSAETIYLAAGNSPARVGKLAKNSPGTVSVILLAAPPASLVIDNDGYLSYTYFGYMVRAGTDASNLGPQGFFSRFLTFTMLFSDRFGLAGDGGFADSAAGGRVSGVAADRAGKTYLLENGADFGRFPTRIRVISGKPPVVRPSVKGVVSAANFRAGSVSPGELIAIFGENFGSPGLARSLVQSSLIATTIENVAVNIGGSPAPLLAKTDGQINAFVPYIRSSGAVNVMVTVYVDGVASDPFPIVMQATQPALFTANQQGSGQAPALNQDGTVNSVGNPARKGSYVSLYGTGEGEILPARRSGALTVSLPLPLIAAPVSVTVGGQAATVSYAREAPYLSAGTFQINVPIPDSVPSGDAQVIVTIGGVASAGGTTIAVR
jgi:uncharacterized protein (TIGR03437 family)